MILTSLLFIADSLSVKEKRDKDVSPCPAVDIVQYKDQSDTGTGGASTRFTNKLNIRLPLSPV